MSRLIDPAQEREWIAGLQAGRLEAFRALFDACVPILRRFARVWTPRDVAEDVVQDVLFDLWRRREALRADGSVMPYLFAAVRNRALKYVRHQGIVDRTEGTIHLFGPPGMGEEPRTPDQLVVSDELEQHVRSAIAKLPEPQRAVLLLRWVEGFSYQDIATALAISENAAMLHVSRARRTLAPVLSGILRDEEPETSRNTPRNVMRAG